MQYCCLYGIILSWYSYSYSSTNTRTQTRTHVMIKYLYSYSHILQVHVLILIKPAIASALMAIGPYQSETHSLHLWLSQLGGCLQVGPSQVGMFQNYPDSKVHGANMGPTGPRWAPCWPHELCYLGSILAQPHLSDILPRHLQIIYPNPHLKVLRPTG